MKNIYGQSIFRLIFGIGIVIFAIGLILILFLSYTISQTNIAITECNSFFGLLARTFSSSTDAKCYQAQFIGSMATLYLPTARMAIWLGFGIMATSFVVWLIFAIVKYKTR